MIIKIKPWQLYLIIFFAGVLLGRFLPKNLSTSTPTTATLSASPISTSPNVISESTELVRVTRVIDGDTIEISGGQKVRYIGVDTPETVDPNQPTGCFGKEASLKNQELVLGRQVRLEKDVSETDRFSRLLRYVYITENGNEIMVNEELVKQGFALASSYPPDIKYQEILSAAQTEARDKNRGLWASCPSSSADTLESSTNINVPNSSNPNKLSNTTEDGCLIKGNISTSGEKIYHLPGCGSYEKTVINEQTGEKYFCSESEAIETGFRKAKNCP